MQWAYTIASVAASGEYIGPWIPGDQSTQIAACVCAEDSDLFLESSADGLSVLDSTEAPGTGYKATPPLSNGNYYRVRYENSFTADANVVIIITTAEANPPVPVPIQKGDVLAGTGPGVWSIVQSAGDPDGDSLQVDGSQDAGVSFGPGGGVTFTEAWLTGADIAYAANTDTSIVTMDLDAGTYIVSGQVSFASQAGAAADFVAYIAEGAGDPSTGLVSSSVQNLPAAPGMNGITLALAPKQVVLGAPTTLHLMTRGTGAGNVWHTGDFGDTDITTGFSALKIA